MYDNEKWSKTIHDNKKMKWNNAWQWKNKVKAMHDSEKMNWNNACDEKIKGKQCMTVKK